MIDTLIFGGGPVGMSLALACPQPATLMSLPPPAFDRAYALGSKATDFLRRIHVFPQGNPVRRFFLTAGNAQMNIHAADIGADMLCRIVKETALLKCLQTQLLRVDIDCHVLSVDSQVVDYRVSSQMARLSLSDGNCYETKLLVAADGARSAIARVAHVGAAPHAFGQRVLSMTLRAPLDDDCSAQWFSPHDVLALLPLGDGLFSLVWSLPESRARLLEDGEAVAAAAGKRVNLPLKASDTAVCSFPLLASRRAVRAVQRMAFVGNAARVIHPLAGQGLNLGLADAAFLVQCLNNNQNITATLAAYAGGGGRGEWWHLLTASFNGVTWLPPMALKIGQRRIFRRLAAAVANGVSLFPVQ